MFEELQFDTLTAFSVCYWQLYQSNNEQGYVFSYSSIDRGNNAILIGRIDRHLDILLSINVRFTDPEGNVFYLTLLKGAGGLHQDFLEIYFLVVSDRGE